MYTQSMCVYVCLSACVWWGVFKLCASMWEWLFRNNLLSGQYVIQGSMTMIHCLGLKKVFIFCYCSVINFVFENVWAPLADSCYCE